jgi:hypothetical protein
MTNPSNEDAPSPAPGNEPSGGAPDREVPERGYDNDRVRTEKSLGNVSETHWSRSRKDLNQEELEFLRQKSQAPGVAEGGALRNHYCMECNGVIPLEYDSNESREGEPPEHCPHCGAETGGGVRMMFNWVEIDQAPGSDAKALMPFFIAIVLGLLGILWWIFS